MTNRVETICSIASAIGQSGIGIVRVSGPLAKPTSKKILRADLKPRYAYYGDFYDQNNVIDKGVAIFFPGPNSYTCLLYTSPSPRDKRQSRMPSSA